MKCPECGGANEDGAAICEHCDHIIDPSFLGDDYTDESDGPDDLSEDEFDEDTPAEDDSADDLDDATYNGPEPAKPAARRRSMASANYVADDESEDEAEWEDEEFADIERERAALRAAREKSLPPKSKTGQATAPAAEKPSLGVEVSRVSADVEGTLSKILSFWKNLAKPDKLTIGGSLAMFLFSLFPWVEIQGQGTLAGLEVGGWFLMLLAACAGTLVYLRQDDHWRGREKYILIVQAAVAGIAVLFVLVKMVTRGSVQVKVQGGLASPHTFETSVAVGVVLAFIAAIVVAAGTGILFKEKVLGK